MASHKTKIYATTIFLYYVSFGESSKFIWNLVHEDSSTTSKMIKSSCEYKIAPHTHFSMVLRYSQRESFGFQSCHFLPNDLFLLVSLSAVVRSVVVVLLILLVVVVSSLVVVLIYKSTYLRMVPRVRKRNYQDAVIQGQVLALKVSLWRCDETLIIDPLSCGGVEVVGEDVVCVYLWWFLRQVILRVVRRTHGQLVTM